MTHCTCSDCVEVEEMQEVTLDVNEYQRFTKSTAIYRPELKFEYLIMGLASEAGEVSGKFKKIIRDNSLFKTTHNISSEEALAIASELGDVLWYVARIADEMGWDMQDVFMENIEKLTSRKERGVIGGSGDSR